MSTPRSFASGLRVPLVAAIGLALTHGLLGRLLVTREPLVAVLGGEYWVAVAALVMLGARALLFLLVPPWLALSLLEAARERARARRERAARKTDASERRAR